MHTNGIVGRDLGINNRPFLPAAVRRKPFQDSLTCRGKDRSRVRTAFSTFRRPSGTQIHISITRWISSAIELKQPNGLTDLRGKGIRLPNPVKRTYQITWFDKARQTDRASWHA